MAVYATSIYLVVNIVLYLLRGEGAMLPEVFLNIGNWAQLVLFNYTTPLFGVGHLWYIFALIYVYLVVAIVEKNIAWDIAYRASVVFTAATLTAQFVSAVTTIEIPGYVYRNWLFTGFPMFAFGRYIQEHEKMLRKVSIPFTSALYIVILTIETLFFRDKFQLMISSVLLCVILMKIAVEKPDVDLFSEMGKKYSQWVYVYHYLFVIAVGIFTSRLNLKILEWTQPVIVVALTVVFCYITRGINAKVMKMGT